MHFLSILVFSQFVLTSLNTVLCLSPHCLTHPLQCDEAASMDEYVRHWTTESQPSPLFFGGGCSVATGLPGDMSRNYHTVQVGKGEGEGDRCGVRVRGEERG